MVVLDGAARVGVGVGATAGYMIGNEADKEEARDNGEIPPTD